MPPGGMARSDRTALSRNDPREAFRRGTVVEPAEDQMARVAVLEEALETARIHHEQYFLGLIRKPPTEERAAVRAGILKLKSGFVRNTAVKFRVASLHNRLLSYERMWNRTLREMEEGTYRRDLFKARLHRGGPKDDPTRSTTRSAEAARGAPRPDAATTAGAPGAGPPAGAAPVGLDDAHIGELHAAYLDARRRCSEPTEGITVESVGNALRKQLPDLIAKHGARSMEFRVVIQGGKAVLKAVPK